MASSRRSAARAQRPLGPDGSVSSDGRTRLLLGGGVLIAVCAVIAGLVIFSGGEQAQPRSPAPR